METQEKKLIPNDVICMMPLHMNEGRNDQFYSLAERYAKSFPSSSPIGYKLKKLLHQRPMKFTLLSDMSKDIKALIQTSSAEPEHVYLDNALSELITELLDEWRNSETYQYYNLGVRRKILLHGPTGNGKTTIARHIAHAYGLPFVEVNSDMMIKSHMNETGGNIHKLFKNLQEPCVLFWDEVDSIGRRRGMHDNSGPVVENERMVNSLLVNLEKIHPEVVFIGATNRRDILDTAFLRRFDLEIEIGQPTEQQKYEYAQSLIRHYRLPNDFKPSGWSELSSYSAIKTAFIHAARRFVAVNLREKQLTNAERNQ